MIINDQGARIDTDKIERIKPVYGTHVRVYFDDSYVEYEDLDSALARRLADRQNAT